MTDVRIVFPIYGNDETRMRNFLAVKKHIRTTIQWPDYVVRSAKSPGHARNVGARGDLVWDVIVFNDADTICPAEQIRTAVMLAEAEPGLVFAYDLYVRLNAWATRHVLDEGREPDLSYDLLGVDGIFHDSGSMGCVAISRACFEEVGGFDESYEGWGYEDLDFARRCGALWPNRRAPGPVYHLWHGDRRADDSPADSDEEQVRVNEERFRSSTA